MQGQQLGHGGFHPSANPQRRGERPPKGLGLARMAQGQLDVRHILSEAQPSTSNHNFKVKEVQAILQNH